jgi:hypothetical protein
MTLDDIKARLQERADVAAKMHATAPVADVLRVVLSELEGLGEEASPAADRWLTAEQAAPLLGVTVRWMYDHAKNLPFAKRLSRKCLRFSESGLVRYRDRQRAA